MNLMEHINNQYTYIQIAKLKNLKLNLLTKNTLTTNECKTYESILFVAYFKLDCENEIEKSQLK